MLKTALNDQVFNQIIKTHWGQLIALLNNLLHDIELAEDVMQDAIESALTHWTKNGVPKKPESWLFTVAKHKALDKLRRTQNFKSKLNDYSDLLNINSDDKKEDEYAIPDERLRLIFTCCHPAIQENISVALTLQLLGGLTTTEIANAYLLKKETMAQRLVRGKRKIKLAGIPYDIPEQDQFNQRLNAVLKVLYLIFNEGYTAIHGSQRFDLCHEAIRLTKIVMYLCPKQPEVQGLLALMLLNDSRKEARFSENKGFIPLEHQDRSFWDSNQIQTGQDLVQSALKQKSIGFYQLQAVISAIHSEAQDYASTNWHEIVLIYDELLKVTPSDVIKLNRLVAVSHIVLDENLLNELDKLEEKLSHYQPFLLVKADFLYQLDHLDKAKAYLTKAISLTNNHHVINFLKDKLNQYT
ncbi:MAG: RNA polymerase sigma factor [Marinicellaceae bacterium]